MKDGTIMINILRQWALDNEIEKKSNFFWKMMQEATEMNAKQLWGLPGSF